jgi:uncharacterized iron-regulated protein
MTRTIRLSARCGLVAAGLAVLPAHSPAAAPEEACVRTGSWAVPTSGAPLQREPRALFSGLAQRPVVLLGENHDNAEHHRWQLHTLAALHALQPDLVVGFEMFPRRVQDALDQWVAGELTAEEFLARSEWGRVWGFDAELYLPIFHFARMHRIPMIALNVERSLVARVGDAGWASIPPSEREGVTDPAQPSAPYRERLYRSYLEHFPQDHAARRRTEADYTDPDYLRFVESMQLWDRAMAQAIAQRRKGADPPLVVGIMGSGHLRNGFGVPHQLRDLGIANPAVLLPWDADSDCNALTPDLADAVFGVAAVAQSAVQRPRLGVMLDDSSGSVVIREVVKDSVADQAGARSGDVVVTVAGAPARNAGDVIDAVRRQAPGTWLPITVRRGAESMELVARFPPTQ